MRKSAVVLAMLSWTSPVALWAADKPSAGCDSLTGVWDYVAPSPPGRSVIAKLGTKYTFAFIQTPRQSAVGAAAPTTDAEKAAAYSASGAAAFEYSCEGSNGKYRWQMRVLHSLRPEEVGSAMTLEMEVQGDIATWWFLDSGGKRGAPGSARHVK
jgi:hypothetical protein